MAVNRLYFGYIKKFKIPKILFEIKVKKSEILNKTQISYKILSVIDPSVQQHFITHYKQLPLKLHHH